MKIGERLKVKRQEADLTQKELAEILHVSRQTVSSWEVGRTYPDLETLVAISELYQTPLDDLLKEDSRMVEEITNEVKKSQRRKITNILLAFLLLLVTGGSIFFAVRQYQNYQTNDYGLSPGDLLDTTWDMSYDATGDVHQSILSFDNNSVVMFNRYNQGLITPETDPEVVEEHREEWLEKGLEDGVSTYEDMRIAVEEDTYVVTAHGYSQEFTRLSGTIIRDANGIEYYQVFDEANHEDLYFIAEELKNH